MVDVRARGVSISPIKATIKLSLSPIVIRFSIMASALVLAGCAIITLEESQTGSQSLLQRALFREQSNSDIEVVTDIQTTSRAHYEFLIGELALAKEKPDEALEHLRKAAELEESAAPTLRLRLAGLLLQEKLLDEALEQLSIVIEASPEDSNALQLKAGVLAALDREDEAIAIYQRLIDLNGVNSEEPYIFAASLHLQQGQLQKARKVLEDLLGVHQRSFFGNYYLARIAEAESKFTKAESYYLQALELSPRADSVRINLARLYGSMKKFEQGVSVVDQVLERDSSNVEAKTLRAQLLVGQNQLDEAILEFEEVSSLEEDSTKTRFRIGLIKLQRRNVSGAITDFNLVLATKPDNSGARYYLASAYSSLGQISDALDQIKGIKSGQEYFTESRTLGAFLLQREKRFQEAIDLLLEVIETKEDPALLRFLASLYKDDNRLSKAIEIASRVVDLEPDSDQSFFTLGVYQDQNGEFEGAVASMRKAIEINPSNANALNYLGYAFAEREQNLEEAKQLVSKALELEPNNGYYIDSLGWIYFKMGDFEKALVELKRSVELVPNDSVILEHLARAYVAVKDYSSAKEVAKKALEFAPESEDKEVGPRIKKLLSTLP